MKRKRTVALTLSALLMLLLTLPIMPARASSTGSLQLEMGNASKTLFSSTFPQGIVYIDTSFNASNSETNDSWCQYDPAANRLTLIRSASITGYLSAASGNLDIYINNGVTLTLNATNNVGDPSECIGIRMWRGELSFFGTPGTDANKGTLIIQNANKNAQDKTYTLNAAIYADYCPKISLSGGCTIEATGGATNGDPKFLNGSYGLFLQNNSAAATLSLAEGSMLTVEAGETSEGAVSGVSAGANVSSTQEVSLRVSGGSQLTATGRASSQGSRGVNLVSGKKAHMLVEDEGSKLTGTSGSASSGNSYGVSIEVFGATPSLLQIKNGGEVTGTAGDGYSSYGVYVRSGTDDPLILVEKGGALTGTGGALGAYPPTGGGRSYGVYCNKGISLSGRLEGNGGDVIYSQSDFSARSFGVSCDGGTITVDGGELTGKGGAATAQGAIAENYGVMAKRITLTGNHAVLKGVNQKGSTVSQSGVRSYASSYGVYSEGAIAVGNACELQGMAGNASGGAYSYSYGVYSEGTIDASGSLTGDGKSAQESYGVYTKNCDISVSGTLTGTSDALSGSGTESYGVITGRGKVTISGTVNATANGANAGYACIGMSANGGIALTGSGRLTAKAASATPDDRHCAKIPKNGVGANALTAGADAAWRAGSTAAFESLTSTYNDAVPYPYLEVRNDQACKVTPTSVSVSVNAGKEVTLTAQGVAATDDIRWYVSDTQAYNNATELAGKKESSLTFTPGSDRQTKYYFARLALNPDTFYSNIVPVRTYGIELSQKDDYRFPGVTVGYTAASVERAVTVNNTGNAPTGGVAVTLSGTGADSFMVSNASFADILVGGNVSFNVQPKPNLGVGTYTATVTVGAAQGNTNPIVARSFNVSITVAARRYAVMVRLLRDGAAYSGQTISLQAGGEEHFLPELGTRGAYENAAVPEGAYTIYWNGASTGKTLAVNDHLATNVDLYTLSFEPNGGTPAPAQQVVASGCKASAPAAMQNGAMSFTGWYQDEALTVPWTFEADMVTQLTTLYAGWTNAPLLKAEITPNDHFVKGDAPALTMIVGHGLPGLTVNNLSGVAVTVGGVRTALSRDTHYDASTGGSIHIAPKLSWLNALEPGDYSVDIALKGGMYEGMHVYTRFTVTAPLPATGDSASPVPWLCLMAGAVLTLCALLWTRRKVKG